MEDVSESERKNKLFWLGHGTQIQYPESIESKKSNIFVAAFVFYVY